MLSTIKNKERLENRKKRVLLEYQVEDLMPQDKLGKNNFHYDMENDFELVTEAKEATTERFELTGEETMKAMHEIEGTVESINDLKKKAVHLDNRATPALSEHFISSNKIFFRLRLNPN